MNASLPVVVIGAGPVGLAAAAHLLERGLEPLVLEAGERVGAGMLSWAHVRMFSPWRYNVDRAASALLERHGWRLEDPEGFPTGADMAERYLAPLAATPELAPRIRTGSRVIAVSRWRRDRMKDAGRADTPFLVRYVDSRGEHDIRARAVIDASGTTSLPNPMGASGLPARGEAAVAAHVVHGMPDVLGRDRDRYAGRRVLVVGSGHSAFNVLNDLATLAGEAPGTRIVWALRRATVARVLGGGEHDQLRERGALGLAIKRWLEAGVLRAETGFHLESLERTDEGIVARDGERALPPVDEIVSATGFRPDHRILAELRLALDPGTAAPVALAPLIDPNLHSCGSVRPHGIAELAHPDPGVYIVGMKSYGRAPTFLLLTGYEQVRSVVAGIAGDHAAAARVELVLPETGVCITRFADEGEGAPPNRCCAPPLTDSAGLAEAPASATVGCGAGCGSGRPAASAACCA